MEAALDDHSLLDDSGRPVVVAVSGGVDSVALLHCLWHVAESRRLQLHVLHFNHRLRPEAEHEEALGKAPTASPFLPEMRTSTAWMGAKIRLSALIVISAEQCTARAVPCLPSLQPPRCNPPVALVSSAHRCRTDCPTMRSLR